jgi:trk system potassium uptake protein TrkA
MKVIIVGCGRVGSVLAVALDEAGHEVIVIDLLTRAFDRLPPTFKGTAIRANGTDEDALRRAGAEGADLFVALTEGDNRNVMAAQVATEALAIRQVIAKINDPVRAAAYSDLGLATLCRTNLMADAVLDYIGLPASRLPAILGPTGQHPGGDHHSNAAGGGPEGTGVAGRGSGAATPVRSGRAEG